MFLTCTMYPRFGQCQVIPFIHNRITPSSTTYSFISTYYIVKSFHSQFHATLTTVYGPASAMICHFMSNKPKWSPLYRRFIEKYFTCRVTPPFVLPNSMNEKGTFPAIPRSLLLSCNCSS